MPAMVERELVAKAVVSLVDWAGTCKEKGRIRLLEEDQLLYLVVALKRIPDNRRVQPFQIQLPHPLIDSSQEVCLIVNDRSRGMLRKVAKQKVAQEGMRVSKVLGVSKLRSNYSTYEGRRKLCGSYDLFLADRSVVKSLPKLLGKVFYAKKKQPIPIDLTKSQWKPQLDRICRSTFLYLTTGSCSVVKVGRLSQTKEEIVENILTVIEGLEGLVPKGWDNILALHVKSLESPGLPIYQLTPVVKVTSTKPEVEVVKLPEAEEASVDAVPNAAKQEQDEQKQRKTRKAKDSGAVKPKKMKSPLKQQTKLKASRVKSVK